MRNSGTSADAEEANLAMFLDLINARLPDDSRLPTTHTEQAEIYLEFAFLRDYWNRRAGTTLQSGT